MAVPRASAEPVAIAILAKAPVAGSAKTRLAPALGLDGAAQFQARLIARTVETVCAAGTGPVTLWAAPDPDHELFAELASRFALRLARQADGDLGARMLAATAAADGPVLVVGTDCPVLAPHHLEAAAGCLRAGHDGRDGRDVVVIPAEDGGYVLIGSRRPQPALFAGITWSTPTVLAETLRRIADGALTVRALPPLWDVDVPADLERMRAAGLGALVAGLALA